MHVRLTIKAIATAWLVTLSSLGNCEELSCKGLQSAPGIYGYQVRVKDARCEGFYHSLVAAEDLELLSLTKGPITFKLDVDDSLTLAAPDINPLKATRLQIQAKAIPIGTYYRMDTAINSTQSMSWQTATVLRPAKLSADSIGLLSWVEQGLTKIFVPISVSRGDSSAQNTTDLVAILRPSIDLDLLQWRSWPDGSSQKSLDWTKVAGGKKTFRAGDPVHLNLKPESKTRIVEISAKAKGSDRWLAARFVVFEP
jgi:hypothetical protein